LPAVPSEKPRSLDGPVSRYLNRPLSRPLARVLARTPSTPNQVTVASALLALAAGCLFGFAYWSLALIAGATNVVV
jgi:hypothetical protein